VLDGAPSWTYDSSSVGTAIAFGDINGDEWPDLVVGNSGEPCVKVFLAEVDVTGVEVPEVGLRFVGAAPNPFNPLVKLSFEMPVAASARLTVHDTRGRLVATLVGGQSLESGRHTLAWDGRNDQGQSLPSGVYLCRLEAGEHSARMRVLLAK